MKTWEKIYVALYITVVVVILKGQFEIYKKQERIWKMQERILNPPKSRW